MKHKFFLIAVSLFIALALLSAGRAAWQEPLRIEGTLTAAPPGEDAGGTVPQAAAAEERCTGSTETVSAKVLPEKSGKTGAETVAAVPDAAEAGEESPGAAAQATENETDSEPEAGVEEEAAEPGSGADSAGGGEDEEEPPAGEGAGAPE